MTDRFADVNAIGESGKSPITNAGRVAINGFLHEEEIINRKATYQIGTALYQGPTDDDVFAIHPREVCIREKMSMSGERNRHKMHSPYVLSVVNGAGENGQSIWEFIETRDFAGLAGGQGAKYDGDGVSPEVDFALVQGGVITMKNTGPKRIENNQWIYWGVPDPASPYDRGVRGSKRMPYTIHPYDPSSDQLTEDTIAELLMNSRHKKKSTTGFDQEHLWPVQEGALNLEYALKQIYLEAYHVLLTSGLVAIRGNPFSPRDREENAAEYLGLSPEGKKNLLRSVAVSLGVKDIPKRTNDPKFTFRTSLKSRIETTLPEYLIDVFLARKDEALLLPLTEGTKNLPPGDAGVIIRNQKALPSDLFAAINKANHFVQRRIIGKAISPMDSGKEGDVLLGRYSA